MPTPLVKNDTFQTFREVVNEIIANAENNPLIERSITSPLSSDVDYTIGDFWIETGSVNRLYTLVSLTGGSALWQVVYSSDPEETRNFLDVYSKSENDSITDNIIASLNEGGSFIINDFNDDAWVGTVINGGTPLHDFFSANFSQPINNNGYSGNIAVKTSLSNQFGGSCVYNIKSGSTILSTSSINASDLIEQPNLSSSPLIENHQIILLELNIPEANVDDALILECVISGTIFIESVELFPIANNFYPSALDKRFADIDAAFSPLDEIELSSAIAFGVEQVKPMGLVNIRCIDSANHGFLAISTFRNVNVNIFSDSIGTVRSLAAPGTGDGGVEFIDSIVEITDIRFRDCTLFTTTDCKITFRNSSLFQSGFTNNAQFHFIGGSFILNGDLIISRTASATPSVSTAGLILDNCRILEGALGAGTLTITSQLLDGISMINCLGYFNSVSINKNATNPKIGVLAQNNTLVSIGTFNVTGGGVTSSPTVNTFGNNGSRIST